jgi:hypothetical protein
MTPTPLKLALRAVLGNIEMPVPNQSVNCGRFNIHPKNVKTPAATA